MTGSGGVRWLECHQVALYLGALAVGAAAGLGAPSVAGGLDVMITPVLGLLLFATFLGVPIIELPHVDQRCCTEVHRRDEQARCAVRRHPAHGRRRPARCRPELLRAERRVRDYPAGTYTIASLVIIIPLLILGWYLMRVRILEIAKAREGYTGAFPMVANRLLGDSASHPKKE
ncbi:hypothetical protein B7R22_07480 [Subtercola boreus]|uniref:Uncharacterized protein n=1 Tax=Subtercola boreus TaxID=120213 RepID=A0A3E0VY69_9MICO|nr:hypothetical protein B7R22_07480 [Subtercola boreus]